MPGMGTTLLYGMFLPFTFVLEPQHAVAFLLSISVGVGFGNSIPAILLGIPGTPSAVLTVIDGHTLHKQGKSGLALGTSFLSALGGQTISILFFIILVIPLMGLAYEFLYPELFALYLLGILAIVSLTGDNMIKGIVAACFGFAIAMIGLDPVNLTTRFTFDQRILRSGVNLTAVLIGLLAVSEIFRSFRQTFNWSVPGGKVLDNQKFPTRHEIRGMVPAAMTGTIVGTFVGAIPGAGATPAALISYQAAQLLSKTPEQFGKGSVEGIAANEAAQNASNSGELIPTLGLGVPGSSSMVLLLSALTVQGFVPGPLMISKAPDLLYAAIAGMLAATVILAASGWFLSSLMLRAVSVNRTAVLVLSLATVILGVFSLNTRIIDVAVMLIAGGIGYLMLRYGYSTAAAALACVLGGELERSLRLGLNLSNGDPLTFVSRPITATILVVILCLLAFGVHSHRRARRRIGKSDATKLDAT